MQEQEMDVFSSMKNSEATGNLCQVLHTTVFALGTFLAVSKSLTKKWLKEKGLLGLTILGNSPRGREVAGRLQLVNAFPFDFNLGRQPMQ